VRKKGSLQGQFWQGEKRSTGVESEGVTSSHVEGEKKIDLWASKREERLGKSREGSGHGNSKSLDTEGVEMYGMFKKRYAESLAGEVLMTLQNNNHPTR